MNDLQLISLLATQIEAAVGAAGWQYTPPGGVPATYPVIQKQQPTQQGIPTSPSVYFEHLFDVAYGYPYVSNQYDSTTQVLSEVELQPTETTFQISAWVIQNPNDLTIPTASDVVKFVRDFLKTKATVRLFSQSQVGILRIREVHNPYIEDDRHRNEAVPSFDITLTHSTVISTPVPYVTDLTGAPQVVQ